MVEVVANETASDPVVVNPAAITAAALSHAGEFHHLTDSYGQLVWVSPAVHPVLGHNQHEFMAMPSWSLIHPDDVDRVRRIQAEVSEVEGAPRRVRYRARHADASWRWVEAVMANMNGRSGVEGIVTTIRDITSQVVAKRRLSQSERRLRSIVSSASDVIAIVDELGSIEYVTPTAATILQRSVSLMQADWVRYLHPDDFGRMTEVFETALEDPGVTKGPTDLRMLRGDGEWLTFEALFTDYRNDPIVRGIVLNARDVTDRRRVEASERASQVIFNALVEMAPVGIFLADGDAHWTYANSRIGNDFDMDSADLLGTGWHQLFDDADIHRLHTELADWNGEGRYVTELRTRHASRVRELRLTVSRPRSVDGELGAVGTLEDVTSRRGLDEMLLDGAALGSVAGVVGSAAHDLHNLLASIGFQIGLLPTPDDSVERVTAANEAIDRACDITEDLMAMSRPGRSRVAALDVGEAIEGLSDMLRVLVEHAADLHFSAGVDGVLVAVDRSGLERVVTNLVVNARDAVVSRGTIAVSVNRALLGADGPENCTPGDYVAISVDDDGCGIPDSLLSRMFEPYFTTKEDGNGIGLAASLRAVRGWGGDIDVASIEGEGTTMTVYLPIAER